MSKKKILICYSGGLDSMLMEAWAKHTNPDAEIIKVFFAHGQDSLEAELAALPKDVIVRNMDWLDETVTAKAKESDPHAGAIYIPGRNMVFAAIAASQYLPDEIWMGTLYDECNDTATDKNMIFADKMNQTLRYVLSPFYQIGAAAPLIKFPFVEQHWTKTDVVRWGLSSQAITKNDILGTTSCWHNENGPCGQCKQCLKRALILDQFGIVEHHDGLHPLDPENFTQRDVMEGYMRVDPMLANPDEREVRRLITTWMAKWL